MDKDAENYQLFLETGKDSYFADIVLKYKDGLLLFINTYVVDMAAAEDLSIDAFTVLGVKRPKFKGNSSFKTWLYSIGKNLAIDYLRKRERHKELPLEEYANESSGNEMLDSYIKEEQKQELHKSLSKLKPEYRQVLWLKYFENLSGKEMAVIINKSVHATEMLVNRAKNALREQLEKDGFEYEE